MNKISILIAILFVSFAAVAQTETLSFLNSNSSLYYQTKAYHSLPKIDIITENVVINTNAISLPLVDDFSSNTLKPYNFNEVLVTDTIQYATGSCVLTGEFTTQNLGFHTSQSYDYFYNSTSLNVDSVALAPVSVYDFSEATCFPNETSITTYWAPYYRSVLADFDTATGLKLDSTLVIPDDTVAVATIYFANLPDNIFWLDNFAWWNTTNPINPLSIGVATLDGLNNFGLPYNNAVTNAYGAADVLTSKPIDLSLLGTNDDVYLSFFYQSGGLGDLPDPEDSLVVEIMGNDGVWTRKWATEGRVTNGFEQAYIKIMETSFDSLIYANTNFQFRFKNYASLSGNNDHWHLDYVRLDKDRNPNTLDSVIRDVAMLYDFPDYLQTYSMLPWDQMQAGADQFVDTIMIPIRDNGQVEGLQAGAFPLDINIDNSFSADIIYTETGSVFNPQLGQEIKNHEALPFTNFALPALATDSVLFNAQMYVAPINRNSKLENDTIKSSILFHNVMAYDDGSAERAYGVSGGGNEVKRFAYEFNVAVQDTLAAIQIHFSNIDVNVESLVFSLYAWDSLEIGVSEIEQKHILGSIENRKPDYINEKNGFATFVFDTPIIVTDKFYVGWAQIDNRNLQIGYDLNSTKGREKMFVFAGNAWNESIIQTEGSPMLRAVLVGNFPIPTTAIQNISKLQYIKVYPNPTYSILNIEIPESLRSFELSVMDYTGKQVYLGNEKQIDVSSFSKGVYLLSVIDKNSSRRFTSRFVVK